MCYAQDGLHEQNRSVGLRPYALLGYAAGCDIVPPPVIRSVSDDHLLLALELLYDPIVFEVAVIVFVWIYSFTHLNQFLLR